MRSSEVFAARPAIRAPGTVPDGSAPASDTTGLAPCDAYGIGTRAAHHFWTTSAGRLLRFSVHDFILCPAPAKAAYVLVRREAGMLVPLYAGAAFSSSPTANLARIRRLGAHLGANEVHLADVGAERGIADGRRLVRGLRAALARA